MKCHYKGKDYSDCPHLSYKEINGYYESNICLLTRDYCKLFEKKLNREEMKNDRKRKGNKLHKKH